jgi:hypothetical protein
LAETSIKAEENHFGHMLWIICSFYYLFWGKQIIYYIPPFLKLPKVILNREMSRPMHVDRFTYMWYWHPSLEWWKVFWNPSHMHMHACTLPLLLFYSQVMCVIFFVHLATLFYDSLEHLMYSTWHPRIAAYLHQPCTICRIT